MSRVPLRAATSLCMAIVLSIAVVPAGGVAEAAGPRLPDLDQELPSRLGITVSGSPRQPIYRLGFRSAVSNIGDGPLVIEGHREPGSPQMVADQLLDHPGALRRRVRGVGRLTYVRSSDHQHWHLRGFDRYELRRAGSNRPLVRDRKSGFCLGDRYRVARPLRAAPAQPLFTGGCGLSEPERLRIREGMSVGYGDDYNANLEYQDLRLSGLRAGRYVLVHRTNADRALHETRYDNDAASVLLDLRWRDGVPSFRVLASCPDSADCRRPATAPRASAAAARRSQPEPFLPDDTGSLGVAGGWKREQWNFAGPFGVRAPRAWANLIAAGRPGGAGVTIAVLDTGVAYSDKPPYRQSPDLAGTRFVEGYDFVDHDPDALDGDGHGTHVASTIAEQTGNGYGLTGLAYGARIMPVRVLDGSGEAGVGTIANGIRFAAEHGAKVINLSLSFATGVGADDVRPVLDAIDDAHARGSLVVASAGNERNRAIPYPARANHALAVGATTEHGCLASFSDTGADLDIVAPGGGDDRSWRSDSNCRPGRTGRAIAQMTLQGARFGIEDMAGTSMAAPHVSAAAALVAASGVLGADPPPDAIADRIERTARDLGRTGYDTRYGWGLLDAAAATRPGPARTTAARRAGCQPKRRTASARTAAACSSRSRAAR